MCIEKNVEKMSSAVFQLLIKRCFVLVLSASSAWEWPCWEGKWFLLIAVSVVVGLLKIEAVPRCWAFPACGINQIAITQGIHVPRPVPRTGPEERRNVEEKNGHALGRLLLHPSFFLKKTYVAEGFSLFMGHYSTHISKFQKF